MKWSIYLPDMLGNSASDKDWGLLIFLCGEDGMVLRLRAWMCRDLMSCCGTCTMPSQSCPQAVHHYHYSSQCVETIMSIVYPSLSLLITVCRNNHVHNLSITITTHHRVQKQSCPQAVHHYHYTSQCTTIMSTGCPSLSLHITVHHHHVHWMSITITTHHSAPPSCPLDVHHYHYSSQCTTIMSSGCPSLSLLITVHHHHVHWMSITITTHHSAPPLCPQAVHHSQQPSHKDTLVWFAVMCHLSMW